jgi:hypothetical protein
MVATIPGGYDCVTARPELIGMAVIGTAHPMRPRLQRGKPD